MSPFVSEAQRRFFHTNTAKKKGITAAMVKEYDEASKGKKLPERAGNTDYPVIPASNPVESTQDLVQDTIEGINAPVPTSSLGAPVENNSQVVVTPITTYRGSSGDY